MQNDRDLETIPVGALGLINLNGCEALGQKINNYIVDWRNERENEHKTTLAFAGYQRDNYIVKAAVPRFGSGEAKGVINESVRGYDLYLLVDVCNHSLTYNMNGYENHMSPDDIYADVKRIIGAASGKPKSITVIMPFLYESRQHKRSSRESLDCAYALQELTAIGVDNVLTFDAHDPRVQNAIPLKGFDNIMPTYQFIKALLRSTSDLEIDNEHLMVISPDEGAMNRTMYFSSVLGVDIGMFYKRRDYSVVVDGRNPIVAHEFLGSSVEGKDVIIIDDMIAIETSKSAFMSFSCINDSIASLIMGKPHNITAIHDKSKNNKSGFIKPVINEIAEITIKIISFNSSFPSQFLIFI